MNLKLPPNLLRYVAVSGAVAAGCAVLMALWSWSTEPPLVVPGQLSAPANTSSKALLRSDAGERTASRFSTRVDSATQDPGESWFSDDVAWWWPQHVGNAAHSFFCTPRASQDGHKPVMVWTDTRNRVVAYGAAVQGDMLPPYANALAEAGTADGTQIVYAAAQGFQVVVAEKTHTLGISGTKLGCIPSSDD